MTMHLEVIQPGHMVAKGHALLAALMASQKWPLDLVIRESIQNSLDAAKPDTSQVDVNINLLEHSEKDLQTFTSHFSSIQTRLLNSYGHRRYTLEIRDHNTTGLTGPIERNAHEVTKGNLLNLVYDISSPQQRVDGGGSWGLGKTCYFQLGIGLVIYYSRISPSEVRLAICLIEDERNEQRLLQPNTEVPINTGIAWWGDLGSHNNVRPLTDEAEINAFLSLLNVKPFIENQTGTSVIIPFLRDDLSELDQGSWSDELKAFKPYWSNHLPSCLKTAVLRWYPTRLNNPKYGQGPILNVKINGSLITPSMSPLANILQNLYLTTPLAKPSSEFVDDNNQAINFAQESGLEEIRIQSVFSSKSTAGWLAWCRVSRAQLQMTPPDNLPSPWIWATGHLMDPNEQSPPLLAMMRSPGMLIKYVDDASDWLKSIPIDKDRQVIALFVLNGSNTLTQNLRDKAKSQGIHVTLNTLEHYIRSTESATHDDWEDRAGGWDIVSRIKKSVARKLKDKFKEHQVAEVVTEEQVGASQFLGNLLLPPGFGTEPTDLKPNPNKVGKSRKSYNKSLLTVSVLNYLASENHNEVLLKFNLVLSKSGEGVFDLTVGSESGRVGLASWSQDGLLAPVEWLNMNHFNLQGSSIFFPTQCLITPLGNPITTVHNELSITWDNPNQGPKFTWSPELNGKVIHGLISIKRSELFAFNLMFKEKRIESSKGGV